MTQKEEVLELIRTGYYRGEMEIEDLISQIEVAIRKINECPDPHEH